MAVIVERPDRVFVVDGQALPDPDPRMSVEQVRETYMPGFPELTTATVTGPELVDGKIRYTFKRAIGYKG